MHLSICQYFIYIYIIKKCKIPIVLIYIYILKYINICIKIYIYYNIISKFKIYLLCLHVYFDEVEIYQDLYIIISRFN